MDSTTCEYTGLQKAQMGQELLLACVQLLVLKDAVMSWGRGQGERKR